MALAVMAGLWPLRLRSLHVDCCDCERVMGVNQNVSGLSRDGRSLAIAAKALTRRLLRRGARYGSKLEHMRHDGWALAIAPQGLYTQTSALGNAL